MNVFFSVVRNNTYENSLYLQTSLKRGNGEQREILLLFGITHQVNIDQLLHLQGGAVRGEQTDLIQIM